MTQFGNVMSGFSSLFYNLVLFVSHFYNVIIENLKNYLEKTILPSDISLGELLNDIVLNMNIHSENIYNYVNDNLFSNK